MKIKEYRKETEVQCLRDKVRAPQVSGWEDRKEKERRRRRKGVKERERERSARTVGDDVHSVQTWLVFPVLQAQVWVLRRKEEGEEEEEEQMRSRQREFGN